MPLLKSKISDTPMYEGEHYFDGWLLSRLGKFTASKIYTCMRPKGIGDGGLTYIRSRIGEEMTGQSSEKQIMTEDMLWGLKYEREALQRFGELKKLDYLIVQKVVCEPGSKFGCTPDGIWINSENKEKGTVTVRTVETKCYQMDNHIACALCSTPAEIRSTDFEAYMQVLMQIQECDSLWGYLVYYNPTFKHGGFRVIEFNSQDKAILADLKLMNQRRQEILSIYEREKDILMNIVNQ